MIKYFGKILIGGLLLVGVYTNSLAVDSKAKEIRNIYYDNFEHTDNVNINTSSGLDVNYQANLSNVGDYYEITFDVVNNSGVDVEVGDYYCPTDDNYINYDFSYANGDKIAKGDILKKGESKRLKYKVIYANMVTEDNYTFDSSFAIHYNQKF